ncbi:DNA polymerase eta-like [Diadema antillarum]|uniref:DNA polymerase eta-like n=1 Tax=Diadema antillarum TaxID=105358 RepID=UPI003A8B9311
MAREPRVVILIDMDCFYVQVEQRHNPHIKGKPSAVVQYNAWKGGGIIAVSYEARKFGVTRQMRGDEARQKCPDIQLVKVPESRGKADLTRYREAGAEVITVLCKYSKSVERASVDEAYVDVTEEVQERLSCMGEGRGIEASSLPQTFIKGYDTAEDGVDIEDVRRRGLETWLQTDDVEMKKLAVGAMIAEEMRTAVVKETGFHCSAGISHNKMLAKIACGFHKPNRQSVLPPAALEGVFKTVPVRKFRNLGGKLGHSLSEDLGVEYMGDLLRYTEKQLQMRYGDKTGSWLFGICRGVDDEPVRPRQLPKSTGCSKNFTGKNALDTKDKVKYWLRSLAEEVEHRLQREEELNDRRAKHLAVYVRQAGTPPTTASRSCAICHISSEAIARDCYMVIQNLNQAGNHQAAWSPAIICLGISASKFVDLRGSKSAAASIDAFLKAVPSRSSDQPEEPKGTVSKASSRKRSSIERFLTQPKPEDREGETEIPRDAAGETLQGKKPASPRRGTIKTFFSPRTDRGIDGSDGKTKLNSKDGNMKSNDGESKEHLGVANKVSDMNVDKSRVSGDLVQTNSLCGRHVTSGDKISDEDEPIKGKSFFARFKQKQEREKARKESTRHENNCVSQDISKVATTDALSNPQRRLTEANCAGADKIEMRYHEPPEPMDLSSDDDFADGRKYSGNNVKSSASVHHSQCNISEACSGKSLTDLNSKQNSASFQIQEDCGPAASKNRTAAERTQPTEDEIRCEKCHEIVPVWDYPEHVDYHVALELQESERAGARTSASAGATDSKPRPAPPIRIGKKRGRPPGSKNGTKKARPGTDNSGPGTSTLHSFFKPK